MGKHSEIAGALHKDKYNCAQAVACAFAQDLGFNAEEMFRAMEGFGSGMGCMDGPCGALTGACAAISYGNSLGIEARPGNKAATYKLTAKAYKMFEESVGAIACKEIKGVGDIKHAPLMSCNDCVRTGAAIAEEIIAQNRQSQEA